MDTSSPSYSESIFPDFSELNTITGYVDLTKGYTLNPLTGLLTVTLNTIDFLTILKDSSVLNNPNKQINVTDIQMPQSKTVVVDLLPIYIPDNYNAKSPNDPTQLIIMSTDSKYIFIDPTKPTGYMFLMLAILSQTPPPSIITFLALFLISMSEYTPVYDSTYNSIKDNLDIPAQAKQIYKASLIAKDPPANLLSLISDRKKWTDASTLLKAMYTIFTDPTISNDQVPLCIKPAFNVTVDKELLPIICTTGQPSVLSIKRNIPPSVAPSVNTSTNINNDLNGDDLRALSKYSMYSSLCCILLLLLSFIGIFKLFAKPTA